MFYLILHIVSILCFFQVMRWVQQREYELMPIVAVNYAVAGLLGLAWLLIGGYQKWPFPGTLLSIAAVNGVVYVLHLLVMFTCIRRVGVGISATVASMSAVSPVIWSCLVHDESLSRLQVLALCLVPVAMILCRAVSRRGDDLQRLLNGNWWLLANFTMASLISILHGEVKYIGDNMQPFYATALYFSAMISAFIFLFVKSKRLTLTSLYVGVGLGIPNGLATVFVLLALMTLPNIAVFPVAGCSIIIGSATLGYLWWRETLLLRQFIGLLFAVLVIVLINLHNF